MFASSASLDERCTSVKLAKIGASGVEQSVSKHPKIQQGFVQLHGFHSSNSNLIFFDKLHFFLFFFINVAKRGE